MEITFSVCLLTALTGVLLYVLRDHDLATAERGEEWTIQGVVAVSMDWLVGVMDSTAAAGKTLGVEIDEVWYYVSPLNMEPTVVGDGYVVIGLYR